MSVYAITVTSSYLAELTVAGSAPVSAGLQGPSERPLKSSNSGQKSFLGAEPRWSVVVVHAQEKSAAWAAAGA